MEATAEIIIEDGIIVAPKTDISTIVFSGRDQSQKIIDRLRQEALLHAPELTTKAGRDAIASTAYKVSKSKVVLLKMADSLTAEWKEKTKVVTLEKSFFEKECDKLRDEIRAPLTQWEEEEAAKEAAAAARQKMMQDEEEAHKENALFDRMKELEAKEAELNRIESERLAKEEAERVESARIEAERIAKEEEALRIKAAEEKARKEAEEKAKAEIEAAQQREIAAKVEAERQKQALVDAEAKAEANRILAEQRAKEEQERAVKDAQDIAEQMARLKENERLAAEEAELKAQALKAANKEHQRKVNREALAGLVKLGMTEECGKSFIAALVAGDVPHITINY